MEAGEQDKFPLAIGRGGKKVDIYRFGVLMLSFAVGEIVHDSVSIPKGLPSDFTDFLKKCLNKGQAHRMFSRFLNLRFIFLKIFFVLFFLQGRSFLLT